mmetsp:Transcript_2923/g.381  ORF Transcript_2923/g.381 Transcript_2923/m.381 type:complete len:87 (-) Transcript_2923:1143-1403(-)
MTVSFQYLKTMRKTTFQYKSIIPTTGAQPTNLGGSKERLLDSSNLMILMTSIIIAMISETLMYGQPLRPSLMRINPKSQYVSLLPR